MRWYYFDYEGTWATLTVRLTKDELDAYLLSIENNYGYRYNGINEDLYGWKEYIKEERRLYFGYPHGEVGDVYYVEVQKAPGVSVPDVHFDNMELDYNEEGYHFFSICSELIPRGITIEIYTTLDLDK